MITRHTRWTLRFPLALVVSCLALALPAARAEPGGAPVANQLSLSASATAEVLNDVLSIVFSTQREGSDPAAVQAQLNQALSTALAEARKAARPGQVDISTGNFSVQPRYMPKGEPTRWQGTVELRAEGRDFDALTQLVGRIQSLSVAQVGYRLSREAREKAEAEVGAQAIARFRAQAEAHARAFGFNAVTLRAVEISTSASGPPMPRLRAAGAEAAMPAALPVAAGNSEVSVVVSGSVQMQK
ncbi:MAG TPA: SIMPL domain-containing protein [Rubrivivax sp.]|nr:SIMPL domain-containing protein [Rubrivivax sp.]